jgi:hypothetical protein
VPDAVTSPRAPRRRPRRAARPALTSTLPFRRRDVQIDLRQLTLRAQALAQALAAQPPRSAPGPIVLESVGATVRQGFPPEMYAWFDRVQLDSPHQIVWRSWSPQRPTDDPPTALLRWLERETASLPLGYVPIRPTCQPVFRAPAAELAAAERDMLDRRQVLEELRRLGTPVSANAWPELVAGHIAPLPAAYAAGTPRWLRQEIHALSTAIKRG